MTDKITITQYDRVSLPDHPDYRAYIGVMFSTGVYVRHTVTTDGKYLEQIFMPDDYDSVYDDILVEDEFDRAELDEYVSVWLDVTLEEINQEEVGSWDQKLIRGDRSGSPTNIRFNS